MYTDRDREPSFGLAGPVIEFVATFSFYTIVQIWYVIVDDDSRSVDRHFKVESILVFLGRF